MSPKKSCIPSLESTQAFWLIMAQVRHVRSELYPRKRRKRKSPHEMSGRSRPSADGGIDSLVYELSHKGMIYGLTEDEIKIIEGM